MKGFNIEELGQMVIQPIRFHGHVIRKLSDWCSVVPDISIDAELPSLEVQLGPGDYSAILSLVNSLGDGRSTTPPSDKREGETIPSTPPTTTRRKLKGHINRACITVCKYCLELSHFSFSCRCSGYEFKKKNFLVKLIEM